MKKDVLIRSKKTRAIKKAFAERNAKLVLAQKKEQRGKKRVLIKICDTPKTYEERWVPEDLQPRKEDVLLSRCIVCPFMEDLNKPCPDICPEHI